jgi:hypothetical protein
VVDVFHDEGYQAQIKKAVFDLKTGELSSKHDFVAFGPLGKIKSQGLKIINKGKKKGKVVIFTKKAKMVLFFDKMAKNK